MKLSLGNSLLRQGKRSLLGTTTRINIYFDSSGSMDETLTPLQNMRDNQLKDALIQFYDNDESLYNSRVQVIDFTGEQTFDQLDNGNLENPLINIVFQDEASPVYHDTSFLDTESRTATYDTDMAAYRAFLENDLIINYRGFIFHVASGATGEVDFRAFLQAVENGTGNYAGENGLSDKTQPAFIYDLNNGDTAQYYYNILSDALRQSGIDI